ncbi:hypothetical protein SAMN05216266_101182 [Amycolatopsis marina]|uniref:Uncharacterized protein n=1 Tax=Amycolatopsis marina TaxID=490629 RepID=A0A1I0VDF2_9PSEU|nr:hypothetical protein SAMN05216266_101182 [Amycolatopsis marina]
MLRKRILMCTLALAAFLTTATARQSWQQDR